MVEMRDGQLDHCRCWLTLEGVTMAGFGASGE